MSQRTELLEAADIPLCNHWAVLKPADGFPIKLLKSCNKINIPQKNPLLT